MDSNTRLEEAADNHVQKHYGGANYNAEQDFKAGAEWQAKELAGEQEEDVYRVLLLASYCGNNPDCTENHPCPDCLQMCNVYEVPRSIILLPKCVGQFDQNP